MLRILFNAERYKLQRHPLTFLALSLIMLLSTLLFYRLCVDYFQLMQKAFESNTLLSVPTEIIQPLCSWHILLQILVLPLFTTLAFSQEYKNKTFYLYTNHSFGSTQIFLSKYLALCSLSITLISFLAALIITLTTDLNWAWIGCQLLSTLLISFSIVSLSLCLSACISNPLTALVLSYLAIFLLSTIEWLNPFGKMGAILAQAFSLLSHSYRLMNGVIYSPDLFYYLIFNLLFIYLGIEGLHYKMSRLRL